MATHSSIFAWRIPWTEQPGRLWSVGSQTVGHHWLNSGHTRRVFLGQVAEGRRARLLLVFGAVAGTGPQPQRGGWTWMTQWELGGCWETGVQARAREGPDCQPLCFYSAKASEGWIHRRLGSFGSHGLEGQGAQGCSNLCPRQGGDILLHQPRNGISNKSSVVNCSSWHRPGQLPAGAQHASVDQSAGLSGGSCVRSTSPHPLAGEWAGVRANFGMPPSPREIPQHSQAIWSESHFSPPPQGWTEQRLSCSSLEPEVQLWGAEDLGFLLPIPENQYPCYHTPRALACWLWSVAPSSPSPIRSRSQTLLSALIAGGSERVPRCPHRFYESHQAQDSVQADGGRDDSYLTTRCSWHLNIQDHPDPGHLFCCVNLKRYCVFGLKKAGLE